MIKDAHIPMKFKTILLKYHIKDFKAIEKKKSMRQMSWEDYIFLAIMNLENVKAKDVVRFS